MNIVCNTLQVEKVRTFTQKQPGTTAFHVTHVACHGIILHDIYQMSLTHRIHKLNIRGLSHSYKVVECYRRTDRQTKEEQSNPRELLCFTDNTKTIIKHIYNVLTP